MTFTFIIEHSPGPIVNKFHICVGPTGLRGTKWSGSPGHDHAAATPIYGKNL